MIQNIVYENIAVLAVIFDLTPGLGQPSVDLVLEDAPFRTASIAQARGQDLGVGRENKDADRIRNLLPYLGGSLNVDVEQQILPCCLGISK